MRAIAKELSQLQADNAELQRHVASLRAVIQSALNIERQIGPHDSIVGPNTRLIERCEDALKATKQ